MGISERIKKYDDDICIEEGMDLGKVVNEKPHFILKKITVHTDVSFFGSKHG